MRVAARNASRRDDGNGRGVGPFTAEAAASPEAAVSPGVALDAPASLEIAEGGSATYAVRLLTAPSADVTVVGVEQRRPTVAEVGPASLAFTPENWAAPQTVRVYVHQDDDAANPPNPAATLTHAVASEDAGYNGLTVASLLLSVTDDDEAGVSVRPTALAVTEGGAAATYALALATLPSADVTVTVAGGDGSGRGRRHGRRR